MEKWVDIPEDSREISNLGNIRYKKSKKPSYIYVGKTNNHVCKKIRVIQLDIDGNKIAEFPSITSSGINKRFLDSYYKGYFWLSQERWSSIIKMNKQKRIKKLKTLI